MSKKMEINEMFTLKSLKEGIEQDYEECLKKASHDSSHYKYLYKVFDFLCDIESTDKMGDNLFPKINKERIERIVEEDLFLFGYTYFLSSDPAYAYTWTYQQQKEVQYIDFISNACNYIHHIVADINYFKAHYNFKEDFCFIFNDLIEIGITKENQISNPKLIWNNFRRITDVKRGYYISIKYGNVNVATKFSRYGKNHEQDIQTLMNSAILSLDMTDDFRGNIKETIANQEV